MNLLTRAGAVIGAAPPELIAAAPAEIGRAFLFRGVAFVRLSRGLRFWGDADRRAWEHQTRLDPHQGSFAPAGLS